MKKSSALMFSYILILVTTGVVDAYTDWNGLDQIALAATVAGCAFALADYFDWGATYMRTMLDKFKQLGDTQRIELLQTLDETSKDDTEIKKAIALLDPYVSTDADVAEIIDRLKKLERINNNLKSTAQESMEIINEIERKDEKIENRCNMMKWLESFFATLGFVIFFVLVIFDSTVEWFIHLSSRITVMAFALIMLNYFMKDVFEGFVQKMIDEIITSGENMANSRNQLNNEKTEKSILEIAMDIISDLEKPEEEEGDVEHEQT